MKKNDIYSLGSILTDYSIKVSDSYLDELKLTKGSCKQVATKKFESLLSSTLTSSKYSLGGSSFNSIRLLQKIGVSVHHNSLVNSSLKSNECLGKTAGLKFVSGAQGRCLVMISSDKERTFITDLGVSKKIIFDDIELRALSNSKFCYIECYLLSQPENIKIIKKILLRSKELGVKVILNLSDAHLVRSLSQELTTLLNVGCEGVIGNESEFEELYKVISKEHLSALVPRLYISKGSQGVEYIKNQKTCYFDAIETKIVDKNGAGDAFAAGVLYGLIKNYCGVDLGLKLSSLVLQCAGADLSIENVRENLI